MSNYRRRGGYASSSKPITELPRVPSGPAPGGKRPGAKDPEEQYLETIEDRCVVGEVWEEFDTEGRTTWTVKDGERIPAPINEALVLSSQTTRTTPPSSRAPGEPLHRPVLDIDIPARLIPSTTPGHHHLYLGIDMTWRQYEDIINALANAKVIEEGYARAALNREATFVRLPWVDKKKEEGQ